MIPEPVIVVGGCVLCGLIGYFSHACLYHMELRRMRIESWRAAKIFYARKAFEHINRR